MQLHEQDSQEMTRVRAEKRKYDAVKEEVKNLQKEFKQVIEEAKKNTERIERNEIKKAGKTRSSTRKQAVKQSIYSDSKYVDKGIEDSKENNFSEEELAYMERELKGKKYDKVEKLGLHHIKYLVMYKLIDELRDIKEGKMDSEFHKKFTALGTKPKTEMLCEIRTTLFTNEQRDYINGLLQGLFKTTENDSRGQFKHSEMEYVQIVMLAEATIRIVKHICKFASIEGAVEHMIKCSRKAHGIDDEEEQ